MRLKVGSLKRLIKLLKPGKPVQRYKREGIDQPTSGIKKITLQILQILKDNKNIFRHF